MRYKTDLNSFYFRYMDTIIGALKNENRDYVIIEQENAIVFKKKCFVNIVEYINMIKKNNSNNLLFQFSVIGDAEYVVIYNVNSIREYIDYIIGKVKYVDLNKDYEFCITGTNSRFFLVDRVIRPDRTYMLSRRFEINSYPINGAIVKGNLKRTSEYELIRYIMETVVNHKVGNLNNLESFLTNFLIDNSQNLSRQYINRMQDRTIAPDPLAAQKCEVDVSEDKEYISCYLSIMSKYASKEAIKPYTEFLYKYALNYINKNISDVNIKYYEIAYSTITRDNMLKVQFQLKQKLKDIENKDISNFEKMLNASKF